MSAPSALPASPDEPQTLLEAALRELAPAWRIVSWPVSGLGSRDEWSVILRHRVSGHLKLLGGLSDQDTSGRARGLAPWVVEAYRLGNPEPLRRYLEEVGVTTSPPRSPESGLRFAALDVGLLTSPASERTPQASAADASPAPSPAPGLAGEVAKRWLAQAVLGCSKWRDVWGRARRWRPRSLRGRRWWPASAPTAEARRPRMSVTMLQAVRRELTFWRLRRTHNHGRSQD